MTDAERVEKYRSLYLDSVRKIDVLTIDRNHFANRYTNVLENLKSAEKQIQKLESEKADLLRKYHRLEDMLSKIHEQAVLKADLLKIFDEDSQPE